MRCVERPEVVTKTLDDLIDVILNGPEHPLTRLDSPNYRNVGGRGWDLEVGHNWWNDFTEEYPALWISYVPGQGMIYYVQTDYGNQETDLDRPTFWKLLRELVWRRAQHLLRHLMVVVV